MAVRQITFLSDFGHQDVFVGLCHAVIAGIAPSAPVSDLTHDIPSHDVRAGAVALEDCVPYVEAAVHLAVVDPGVGSHRAGVVLVAGDALLVGPDNGLLLPAARRLGGVTAAYHLSAPRFRAAQVSRTFHGRDVFAPAAAHLANGRDPADLGDPVDAAGLVDLELPSAVVGAYVLRAPVRGVDRFGNVQLAATVGDLHDAGLSAPAALRLVTPRGGCDLTVVGTYADLDDGVTGLIEDSFGWLAVVMPGEAAATRLRIGLSDQVTVVAR